MFSSLHIGASALYASQRAVQTAAHNVANVNTDGYTRQRLETTASRPGVGTPGMRGSGMLGTGVQVVDITRVRDRLADLAFRTENAGAGSAYARSAVLDRAQQILGPYGEGVPATLSRFWASWDQLALTPSDPAARQLVLDAGRALADGVRDAAGQLSQIRSDLLEGLQDNVDRVNALTSRVAQLNQLIAEASTGGQAPNDLLDQRDLAIDELSGLTGATARPGKDGTVDVHVGSGVLVRGNTARVIVATSTPPPVGSSWGADPGVTFADGAPLQPGGALGGAVATARGDLRDFETALDAFAVALRDTVNAAHAAGFDLAGQPGGAVFTGTGAGDLDVPAELTAGKLAAAGTQVAGGSPNDGNNALALANLRSRTVAGASLADQLNAVAAQLGSRAIGAQRAAEAAGLATEHADVARAAVHGVSIDEEMVDLVKFQHAYDAAARVVSIADGMLDTLINRMGSGR